jgi:large subunit ribosomal protein L40
MLLAEPLKKKKKLDPQIIKQREERRRKKLEKQIKRLERNARQLKPIDELEVPLTLLDEKKSVIRSLSGELFN